MRNELIKAPLTESWALLRKEWRGIVWGLIKIDLLALAAALVGFLIVGLAAFLLSGVSFWAAIAVAIVLAIPLIFVLQAISSIAYIFIDAAWSKKRISYSEAFRENLLPVTGWAIVMFLINAAVAVPFIALFALALLGADGGDLLQQGSGSLIFTLAELLFRIFLSIALAVVGLFTQFAIFEIVLSRSGVLSGFGKSFSLVKRNIVETVLFCFILWVIEVAISIPLFILIFALVFFGILGLAIPGAGIIVMALIALIVIPLAIFVGAITKGISITARYRFWGRARVRG